jgi:GntR family transcriptional regulator
MLTSIRLDPGSPVPLHHQLAQQLRASLDSGSLPVGQTLPPEDDIATYLHVSRSTVRQALASLVHEGRLDRRRNRGTVVTAPPVQQSLEGFYSFARMMAERGMAQHSRVLLLTLRAAPDDVSSILQCRTSDAVFLERLRYAEESPLLLERCWFAQDVGQHFFAEDLATASLYDILEKHGIPVSRATETIRPVIVCADDAKLLTVEAGNPAFFVERISYCAGRAIEVRRSLIRGDRYLYSVDLPRSTAAGRASGQGSDIE